jgi:tartrate-resistant acid phosphatase type 5
MHDWGLNRGLLRRAPLAMTPGNVRPRGWALRCAPVVFLCCLGLILAACGPAAARVPAMSATVSQGQTASATGQATAVVSRPSAPTASPETARESIQTSVPSPAVSTTSTYTLAAAVEPTSSPAQRSATPTVPPTSTVAPGATASLSPVSPGGEGGPRGTGTPATTPAAPASARIAVIGDYGLAGPAERDVSSLVKGWDPDVIITTGDNNYPNGSAPTIDKNVGQFYSDYIYPYHGAYGKGADRNRFFPCLGNHDWVDPGAAAYLDYFTLPGNERYYDFVVGDVQLFALDSMPGEPDGITQDSRQAAWLRDGLAKSTSRWKLVYMHHPPFSSGPHGSTPRLQWPYAAWGATAVLAGHDHIYERIMRDGIPYFVDGLGGSVRYAIGNPVDGSQARYSADFGAMLIEADDRQITFEFVTRKGEVIDSYTVQGGTSLMHPPAASDIEQLTRHPVRLLGGEEYDHVGDIIGTAHTAERRVCGDLCLGSRRDIACLDGAGGYDVDSDAVFAQFSRCRPTV